MLEGIYNFNCTCSLCKAPDAQREVSDKQRDQIIAIRRVLAEPDITLARALELTNELLRLAEQEGLDIKLKDYYNELAQIFFKLRDFDSALDFSEAALAKLDELGPEEDEFKAAIRANIDALTKMKAKQAETKS